MTVLDKRTSLSEAVNLVQDGDVLALGGMTLYRRPVAFVRQLLRRDSPPRDLTLLAFTSSFESDLLVGAGLVSRVRSCYFGLEAFGLAPMFTKLATSGQVHIVEETEASLAFGLRATLAGVSFMPGLGWIGTDMLRVRPDVKLIDDPYGGAPKGSAPDGVGARQYVAFPAIPCDVAVVHALRSDWRGNAHIGGNLCIDSELTLAASRVIVTAEEVVERIEKPIEIPCVQVEAVVHAPRGAWPTSCHPFYPVDGKEIMRYSENCPNGFAAYLETFLSTSSTESRL